MINQLPPQTLIVPVPFEVLPLLASFNFIRQDTDRINECRSEMERERARLEAELREGPPGLKVPVFWMEDRPETPVKAAMELFAKKHKELKEKVPIQWRRDLDNQAEENLHDFEMRGHQLFLEPSKQIKLHKKETLEKLKFPDEIEEIGRCKNAITDEVVNCINSEDKYPILFESLSDQARPMIQAMYMGFIMSHEVHQKAREIIYNLYSIHSQMHSYRHEIMSQSILEEQLKSIDDFCDTVTKQYKKVIEEENIGEIEELMNLDLNQLSSAKDLVEKMNAQDVTLASMKRTFESGLQYIDSIDMNTFAPIKRIKDLYSVIVDLSDDIEQLE